MSRYLAVTACTAGLFLALAVPATGHKGVAPDTCGIERAHTEQLTRYAQVVERTIEDVDDERTRVWACSRVGVGDRPHARRHGYLHRRLVGKVICYPQDSCSYQTVVATAWPRTRVAFTEGGCSRYSLYCGRRIRVVDLKSGQVASTEFVTTSGGLNNFDITATGTAVWLTATAECESYPAECTESVRGLTYTGQALTFDEGPDLSDMALVRNRLYWMRGDEPQTAEVP